MPTGVGKTTLVRILATLLRPDAGTATVAGFDVAGDAAMLRRVIGLTGQLSVTVYAVRSLSEGGPIAHYAWQSAAWIAGFVVVFGWLAVRAYRRL